MLTIAINCPLDIRKHQPWNPNLNLKKVSMERTACPNQRMRFITKRKKYSHHHLCHCDIPCHEKF